MDWESRWVRSTWKESENAQGQWGLSAGKWFTDEAEDKGIQTAEDSKFFGISAAFDSFSNKGKNTLKKSDLAYKQEGEGTSHVYRLIVKPDNTVRVEIDEEKIYEGSIKDDWEVLKPKEIADPDDKKPDDWTDESMIDDPAEVKPDDWGEEKRIVDSEAKKPDDWDDVEDGEWEAPMKDNPAFKGEWSAKRISNPAYKGVWEAKKISNPEYEDDDSVYKYDDFGFIGFDLWQVKGGTIFDNVIITDDKGEADAFLQKWKALSEFEKAEKKKADEAKKAEDDAKKAEEKKNEDAEDDDDDDMDTEADTDAEEM